MVHIRLIGAFASLLFLSVACLPTGSEDGSQNLKQQVARHDQQIRSLLGQVGQVETVLPGQAETWAQLQAVRQEVNQLALKVDEEQGGGVLGERIDRLEALVRKMASQFAISTDSLDAPYSSTPLAGLGSTQNLLTEKAQAVQLGQGNNMYKPVPIVSTPQVNLEPTAAAEATGTNDVQSLYERGIKSFDQRKYQDAIVVFKEFVAKYPNDALASNAYFWQGESYFQMKDYARAILAYQDLLKKYPKSQKTQASMLKQGIALYHVNEKAAAKERLEDLIARYPSSQEASRAKQFLKANN